MIGIDAAPLQTLLRRGAWLSPLLAAMPRTGARSVAHVSLKTGGVEKHRGLWWSLLYSEFSSTGAPSVTTCTPGPTRAEAGAPLWLISVSQYSSKTQGRNLLRTGAVYTSLRAGILVPIIPFRVPLVLQESAKPLNRTGPSSFIIIYSNSSALRPVS